MGILSKKKNYFHEIFWKIFGFVQKDSKNTKNIVNPDFLRFLGIFGFVKKNRKLPKISKILIFRPGNKAQTSIYLQRYIGAYLSLLWFSIFGKKCHFWQKILEFPIFC